MGDAIPESKPLGILAFGSLIEDAGELDDLTVERLPATTPFPVEFARTSSRRGGAPTLIPVAAGGANVAAAVLVLEPSVALAEAKDMLYRREINQVGTKVQYVHKPNPGADDAVVAELNSFAGCDVVLYTTIGENVQPLTTATLADLAVASAKKKAGAKKRDGISYLRAAKKNGIVTQLSPEYEAEILAKTNTENLEAAWLACRKSVKPEHRA